jgi:glycosyltransferase involved in cell wall biosynthesis
MRVLLLEQWHGGHYANYLKCLIPELASLSRQLVIAVTGEMRQWLEAHCAPQALANVDFAPDLPKVSPRLSVSDRYAAARNLMSCIADVKPEFTLLPSADAQSMGLAGMRLFRMNLTKQLGPIEGTLHYGYGYSAQALRERLKEAAYTSICRHVPYDSINFVNFAYYDYALAQRLVPPSRVRFVGDPVPQHPRIGKQAARQLLGLEATGRYVGLLGSLDRRKAIPELLAAFRMARLGSTDRLLLAGRLHPAYAELIRDEYVDLVESGRIVVLDRFLSDRDLEHGYEALDLATVVYYNFPGLASLALKAVAAGTPIIAHDFGWLRAAIRCFEIGVATDIFEPVTFAAALREALDRSSIYTPSEAIGRLLEFHTERNFVTHMVSGLRRAMRESEPPTVSWSWVMEAVSPALRMAAHRGAPSPS